MPRQYEDVHWNPDSDCYMLQVTTLNYILTPVVMGMTLALVSNYCVAFNVFRYVEILFLLTHLPKLSSMSDRDNIMIIYNDNIHIIH